MRIDPLLKIIKENKNSYEKLGIPVIYTDILEPEHQGQEITLTILKNKYKIGYLYITEDHDDWAQAESYQVDWCQENEKEIPIQNLLDILLHTEQYLRDCKLQSLLEK
jgi:hypothetical protein